jgi:hypothetical protein
MNSRTSFLMMASASPERISSPARPRRLAQPDDRKAAEARLSPRVSFCRRARIYFGGLPATSGRRPPPAPVSMHGANGLNSSPGLQQSRRQPMRGSGQGDSPSGLASTTR